MAADADTDKPVQPDGAESAQTNDQNAATPSSRWVAETLWREAPDTSHLKKRRRRVSAPFPAGLLGSFSEITAIEVLGVPPGAEVLGAEETGTGVWRLPADAPEAISVLPPDGPGGIVGLTVKVSGRETPDGETVSAMGGVRVDLPDRTPNTKL